MDLDDLDIDIKIEVTSIEELREVREELQKIAKARREIDVIGDKDDSGGNDPIDVPNPDRDRDPFYPDYPKRDFPHFIMESEQGSGFETSFDVNIDGIEDDMDEFGIDEDEAFSTVGQMREEKFNDRRL